MPLQPSNELRLSSLAPRFLLYAGVELCFAPQSLIKYRDCLRQIERMLGDRTVESFAREDVLTLKSKMLAKGHSVSRQVSILSAFKRILQFAREELGVPALDPATIVVPARPRREVVFLSVEEVARFVNAIKIETLDGKPSLSGLRFRAIVETLLGSAMRIGEVLSLDREDIDFQNREAKIVGKGNKQRTAFFTDRALFWIRTYLEARNSDHPALFVCQDGRTRLKRADMWRPFRRYRKIAGINKPVTPHLLRHTAATQLLFNGCPIGHIKEILGHERLETTCRYYLGLDHRAAKQAHSTYLVYGATDGQELALSSKN
jgi:integrase/recombinase XerD